MKFKNFYENQDNQRLDEYPIAAETVSGLKVLDDIPNMDSISATLSDYEILKGIREVSIEDWNPSGFFYAADDFKRGEELATQIKENKYIKPLIMVIENDEPYILEGAHRLYALSLLKVKSFPALIVEDLD